jgi:hypothetical protein
LTAVHLLLSHRSLNYSIFHIIAGNGYTKVTVFTCRTELFLVDFICKARDANEMCLEGLKSSLLRNKFQILQRVMFNCNVFQFLDISLALLGPGAMQIISLRNVLIS